VGLPRAVGSATGSAAYAFRSVRQAVASLAGGIQSAPRTPLNVAITGERSFASVEYGLDEVKKVARTHDATVNDVILAACAGALRRWLIVHDSLPEAPLVTSVPFSTRDSANTDHSIQVSFMSVTLHTDIEDPHARLRAIHTSAAESKVAAEHDKARCPDALP